MCSWAEFLFYVKTTRKRLFFFSFYDRKPVKKKEGSMFCLFFQVKFDQLSILRIFTTLDDAAKFYSY